MSMMLCPTEMSASLQSLIHKATDLAKSLDVVPSKRRISVKQNFRANIPSESVEDHDRVNLFYTFAEHIISELESRFAKRKEPAMVAAYRAEQRAELLQWYQQDLSDAATVEQELKRWRYKFLFSTVPLPSTAQDTLQTTSMVFFPNIECMLRIFLTIPVTT